MERINPKQVEWLVKYRPCTHFRLYYVALECTDMMLRFTEADINDSKDVDLLKYYLTPETYNSLPTEFKQLAD
jgi:hypothetical protein